MERKEARRSKRRERGRMRKRKRKQRWRDGFQALQVLGSKAEARINPAHHPWLSLPPAPEKSCLHLRDTWAHSVSLRTCHYLLLLFVWSKGQGLRPWDLDTAQGSLSVCWTPFQEKSRFSCDEIKGWVWWVTQPLRHSCLGLPDKIWGVRLKFFKPFFSVS